MSSDTNDRRPQKPYSWEIPAFLTLAAAALAFTLSLGQWTASATIAGTAIVLVFATGFGPFASLSLSHAQRLAGICALFAALLVALWMLGKDPGAIIFYLAILVGLLIRLGFVLSKKGWSAS